MAGGDCSLDFLKLLPLALDMGSEYPAKNFHRVKPAPGLRDAIGDCRI